MNPRTQNNFTNNFVVLVCEYDQENIYLGICMKGNNDFQPISLTAFPLHPHCPAFYHDFPDYESAAQSKLKWEKFLGNYLNK